MGEKDLSEARRAAYTATAQQVGSELRETIPVPERTLGQDVVRHAFQMEDDRRVHAVSPHIRKLFDSFSEADVAKLERLLNLRMSTIEWIDGKNDKELKNLDGTIDLISNSRTAGKILFYVLGVCGTVIAGVFTLAKNGYDIFIMFRGVK